VHDHFRADASGGIVVRLNENSITVHAMNRNLMMAALAALSISFASAALGQDREPLPLPVTKPAQASQKNAPVVVRSESLELPGLTACHQCEWRPRPNQLAAPERRGSSPDGKPLPAEFECGFSQECERVCNFVRCLPQ